MSVRTLFLLIRLPTYTTRKVPNSLRVAGAVGLTPRETTVIRINLDTDSDEFFSRDRH